jgi:ADP-ribose pyrophosphatase YjhB (NUDIX family)
MTKKQYNWLDTASRLQAIAQAGLEFCHSDYDRDRYQQIRDISIEIIENYTEYEQEEIISFFASDKGYPTPKVDVRAAIFKDQKILMVKEKTDGKWSLPGGWADQHLSLSENIIKESKEEAGVNVEPVRIISVLERKRHNTPPIPFGCYKIFVLCHLKGGEFTENTETSDSGYFPFDELPKLSTERNTYEQIRDCFDSQRNDWEVIFD